MKKPSVPVADLLNDPSAHFASPGNVMDDGRLSDKQKRRVLDAWETDARLLAVASEEGMAGGEPTRIDQVKAAEAQLPGAAAGAPDSPAKSG